MKQVLLVEDEPAIADTLIYALETERFAVTYVSTGTEALEAASANQYDFVILDIGLPDMTGLEVCSELRKISSIPILFLTARDAEVDRVLGLELGGDDYVTKPFSPREIVARVRTILRRGNHLLPPDSGKPCEPEVGLKNDPQGMRVLVGGHALDLTAHEYKLLVVLMKQPGRVFSRDQLLDHAWEDPGAVTDRTIDAHIKSIRAKLRNHQEGADLWIETRRGLGYSLSTDC